MAYNGLVQHGFDADDRGYIRDAATVITDPSLFFSPELEFGGRPIVQLVFLANHYFWNSHAGPLHLLQILLHIIASVLIAHTCRALNTDIAVSMATGLFFLLHVGHFSAVHWISAIAYELGLLGLLSAFLLLLKHLSKPNNLYICGFYAAFIFAILSHAATVFAVPLFFALTYFKQRSIRHSVLLLAPLLIAGICFCILTSTIYEATIQIRQNVRPLDLFYIAKHGAHMLSLLFVNAWGFVLPQYERHSLELVCGVLLFGILIWILLRHHHPLRFWILWTILALLPFLNSADFVASRYLYLASAGSAALTAHGVIWTVGRLAMTRIRPQAGFFAVVILCLVSCYGLRQARAYSLFLAGRSNIVEGFADEGHSMLEQALAIAPEVLPLATVHRYIVGHVFGSGSSFDWVLERAVSETPDAPLITLLQAAAKSLEDDNEAEQIALDEITITQRHPDLHLSSAGFAVAMAGIYHNLGVGFAKRQEHSVAIRAFKFALSYDAGRVETSKGIVRSLYQNKQYQKCAALTNIYIARFPGDLELQQMGFVAERALKKSFSKTSQPTAAPH